MRGIAAALLPCVFAMIVVVAGVRKQWTPNWDLNSQDNWREKRLPCAGGEATLPQHPDNTLFLGGDLTVGSLNLPSDGEIIFGPKANLLLDDVSSQGGSCAATEWTHGGQDQWWDPAAWSYPGFEEATSSPVPHLHRVPCTRDAAVFASSNDSLFNVHLTSPPVSITALSIGAQNFTTTSEFAAYTRTPEGLLRFRGASSTSDGAPLYVESPEECTDLTGCLCGSEQAASVICRIMSGKCGSPQCDRPINMTGFCCPVCGAEVTIDHGGTVTLGTTKDLLQRVLRSPKRRDVRGHVAKMSDQRYHVYFTATNPNGNYKEASEAFKTMFDKEVELAGSHDVLVSYAGNMKPLVSGKTGAHQVTVTLVTLAICLGIGAAVYYLRKRRGTSTLSFMFRRLESNSRRVSVVSDVIGGRRPSNASGMFAYSRESGLRFLNPIYNQSMASLVGVGASSVVNESAQEPSAAAAEQQAEGEHENPMYTAYQNMQPEERQASEEAIREREKILEAAGQLVASMEKNKEKRMSAGNNLEAITEEKDAKDGTPDDREDEEAGDDKGRPEATNTASVADKNLDILQEGSPSEDKSGNAIMKEDDTVITPKSHDKKETQEDGGNKEDSQQPEQQHKEVTQTIIDIDGDPVASAASVPKHREASSEQTSSSDDDDTSEALSNLEGFTPLVDLKFKKS